MGLESVGVLNVELLRYGTILFPKFFAFLIEFLDAYDFYRTWCFTCSAVLGH